MNRKLKALGLALFAVFAMSAIGAGVAQAEGEEFHSDAEDVVITDIDDGTFESHIFDAGEAAPGITCNDLDVEGRNTGVGPEGGPYTTDSITVGIDYTNCETEGEEVIVHDDGCHYNISPSTTGGPGHGDVKITGCTNHGGITITTPIVDILVTEQTVPTAVHFDNTTDGTDTVDVKATAIDSIDYHCTPAFFCEIGGITPTGEASYTGALEVGGFVYEEGETGEYKDGTQVDVWHE